MQPLLIVLPCWEDDASRAETLVDWIWQLNAREKQGHALILCAPGVHGEMIEKLRISADLAFVSFSLIHLPQWPVGPQGKDMGINMMALTAAGMVQSEFGWPWLWLEPDAIPLKKGWLLGLAQAYHDQPRRYFGSALMYKGKDGTPDKKFLARVAIYPQDACGDLAPFCQGGHPFHVNPTLVERACRTTLLQNGRFNGDVNTLRPDALLFHTDKEQLLIPILREQVDTKALANRPVLLQQLQQLLPEKKVDKRSREYRETIGRSKAG